MWLGGWPIIQPNWNVNDFDWENAYVKMNQFLGLSVFTMPNDAYIPLPFIVGVTQNIKNTTQNILQVILFYFLF